jgi:uncharacterized protein (DUF1330 family)
METEQPNAEQFKKLFKNSNEGPVVMLNLLKFKPEGGLASYGRYAMEVQKFMTEVGARMIFLSKAGELLIGHETWDVVMLVKYPSRKAFLKMTTNPGYLEIHKYREAAIERSVLYATDEMNARELLSGIGL